MTTKYMNKYENMIWGLFGWKAFFFFSREKVVEKNNIFSCFTSESSDLKDEQIYNKKNNETQVQSITISIIYVNLTYYANLVHFLLHCSYNVFIIFGVVVISWVW